MIFGSLRCEIRCHLRADAHEPVWRFAEIDFNGVSGCCGHSRTVVALGVGSSVLKTKSLDIPFVMDDVPGLLHIDKVCL